VLRSAPTITISLEKLQFFPLLRRDGTSGIAKPLSAFTQVTKDIKIEDKINKDDQHLRAKEGV